MNFNCLDLMKSFKFKCDSTLSNFLSNISNRLLLLLIFHLRFEILFYPLLNYMELNNENFIKLSFLNNIQFDYYFITN
jgi:hypothetical protein